MGSALGGAGSPFRNNFRVFLHSSEEQPKYFPKRPVLSCISAPHLSHSNVGPSYPLSLNSPDSTSNPEQSGLFPQTWSFRFSSTRNEVIALWQMLQRLTVTNCLASWSSSTAASSTSSPGIRFIVWVHRSFGGSAYPEHPRNTPVAPVRICITLSQAGHLMSVSVGRFARMPPTAVLPSPSPRAASSFCSKPS